MFHTHTTPVGRLLRRDGGQGQQPWTEEVEEGLAAGTRGYVPRREGERLCLVL